MICQEHILSTYLRIGKTLCIYYTILSDIRVSFRKIYCNLRESLINILAVKYQILTNYQYFFNYSPWSSYAGSTDPARFQNCQND